MALSGYYGVARTTAGTVVASSAVEVRRKADNSLATIWGDEAGTVAIANGTSFQTDANGVFLFYAEPDRYDVLVGSGASQVTVPADIVDGRAQVPWPSRAQAVTDIAGGFVAPDGTVKSDGTVLYIASDGATAIADMPGWLPFGDWYFDHFGAVADGEEASPTDNKDAIQEGWNAVSDVGGNIYFRDASYATSGPIYLRNATNRTTGAYIRGAGRRATRIKVLGTSRSIFTSNWSGLGAQSDGLANKGIFGVTFEPHSTIASNPRHPIPIDYGVTGNFYTQDIVFNGINGTVISADVSWNHKLRDIEAWGCGHSFVARAVPSTARFSVTQSSAVVTATEAVFVPTDVGRMFAVGGVVRGEIVTYTSGTSVTLDTSASQTTTGAYGAFGAPTAAMTAGSDTLTSAEPCFTADDVGHVVVVEGADGSTRKLFRAEIAAYIDPSNVQLDRTATTTVTGARFAVPVIDHHDRSYREGAAGDFNNDILHENVWVELCGGVCMSMINVAKFRSSECKLHGDFAFEKPTLSCLWAVNVEGVFDTTLLESFTLDHVVEVFGQDTQHLRFPDVQAIAPDGINLFHVADRTNATRTGLVTVGNVAITAGRNSLDGLFENPGDYTGLVVTGSVQMPFSLSGGSIDTHTPIPGTLTVDVMDQSGNSNTIKSVPYTVIGDVVVVFYNFLNNIDTTGLVGTDEVRFTIPETASAAYMCAVNVFGLSSGGGVPYFWQTVGSTQQAKIVSGVNNTPLKVSDINSGVTDVLGGVLTYNRTIT